MQIAVVRKARHSLGSRRQNRLWKPLVQHRHAVLTWRYDTRDIPAIGILAVRFKRLLLAAW